MALRASGSCRSADLNGFGRSVDDVVRGAGKDADALEGEARIDPALRGDKQRHTADDAARIAQQRERAESARGVRQLRRRADDAGAAPDFGKSHVSAGDDRRRRDAAARRGVEHKSKHGGGTLQGGAEPLVAVGKGVGERREVASSETRAQLSRQRCRRVAVGVLEQDVDGDDRRRRRSNPVDELGDGFPRPRPGAHVIDAPGVDIDDDHGRRCSRFLDEGIGGAQDNVPGRLDQAIEQALTGCEKAGGQERNRQRVRRAAAPSLRGAT